MIEKAHAIQTLYNGYMFRSRLEARWSVFFDAMDIKYVYEHQGYQMGRIKFLPDIYFPRIRLWLEIKPEYDETTAIKCKALALTDRMVTMLIGQPWPGEHRLISFDGNEVEYHDGLGFVDDFPPGRMQWAYEQARSARFEFGETPNPVVLRRGPKGKHASI